MEKATMQETLGHDQEKRTRKQRSDKGLVMATRRDMYCIAWIAEQYAARGDQIRRLLSRFPDKLRPFKDGDLIAETTVKDQINRWVRAGWVEYKRILADQPGYCWVTKKGLALVDLDDIYTARVPASTRLNHIYAVNQLRLWMDSKFTWKSERRYRADEMAKEKSKKGQTTGPIPDGIITTKSGPVAIEVELSVKKPADLEQKLIRLVRHYVSTGLGYGPAFPTIWIYVPSEKLKAVVEDAIEALTDEEQNRVSVGIEKDLIASQFRR
jgi:hypothetical protein